MIIHSLFLGLVAALFLWIATLSPIRAGQPTSDQCTCHLEEEGVKKDGADVINGAACFRDVYTANDWCEIEVITLKTVGQQHQLLLSHLFAISAISEADDRVAAVHALFLGIYDNASKSTSFPDDMGRHRPTLEEILEKEAEKIATCISLFNEGSQQTIRSQEQPFVCRVSELSNWLVITIMIEKHIYSFLFSPPV